MGRTRDPIPPLDVEIVREAFALRHDGQIVRRDCHVSHLTGEVATFALKGKLLVRIYLNGKIRRVLATRLAWCLATGEWPDGPLLPRNGDDNDLRFDNLLKVRHGRDPFGQISDKHSNGGKASALARRSESDAALLRTMAENPDATVPQLSRLVGSSSPCTCTRLSRLEAGGLVCSPRCQAHIRWQLSEKGRALAATGGPMIDGTDREILRVIARSPVKLTALARQVGSCNLTARRRVNRLTQHAMVEARDGRYAITDAGRQALGPDAPLRRPWVRVEAISAASARDVLQRHDRPPDDRSAQFRSKVASLGAQSSMAVMKPRKRQGGKWRYDWALTG